MPTSPRGSGGWTGWQWSLLQAGTPDVTRQPPGPVDRSLGNGAHASQTGRMTSFQPALSPDQVLPLLREHQLVWRQRYHLQRIGLFGSTARNEAKAGSDVDVWVELHPLTPFATVHLKQELETLLQRPVDLVRLRERMNPALRQAILREGVSA